MPECPACGHHLIRMHRTTAEKLIYAELFRCAHCDLRLRQLRGRRNAKISFLFSRYTRCIRCGTQHVRRISKRDRVDSVSRGVVSTLLRLTGAPLNKCDACRLQYYDWRPLHAAPRAEQTNN